MGTGMAELLRHGYPSTRTQSSTARPQAKRHGIVLPCRSMRLLGGALRGTWRLAFVWFALLGPARRMLSCAAGNIGPSWAMLGWLHCVLRVGSASALLNAAEQVVDRSGELEVRGQRLRCAASPPHRFTGHLGPRKFLLGS